MRLHKRLSLVILELLQLPTYKIRNEYICCQHMSDFNSLICWWCCLCSRTLLKIYLVLKICDTFTGSTFLDYVFTRHVIYLLAIFGYVLWQVSNFIPYFFSELGCGNIDSKVLCSFNWNFLIYIWNHFGK